MNLNKFRTAGRDIANMGRGLGSYLGSHYNDIMGRGHTGSPWYNKLNVGPGGHLENNVYRKNILPSSGYQPQFRVADIPNDPVRHPGYGGYDITQMMLGENPQFMSELHYAQKADDASGTTNYERTLAAMAAEAARNKARFQNVQQNQAPTPQYNNVATDYYSNRNNKLPGISGLIGMI